MLTRMEYGPGPVGHPGPLRWNVYQHKGLVRGTQEGQQLSLLLPGLVSSGPRRDFLFPWLHHLRFGLGRSRVQGALISELTVSV